MLLIFKRYSLALIFLFLVVFLMLIVTLGVKMFGDKMIEDTNMHMKPRGEVIKI
ncbi:hypothetical protein [Sulfurimonas sp.]